jgi:hypothetical protein
MDSSYQQSCLDIDYEEFPDEEFLCPMCKEDFYGNPEQVKDGDLCGDCEDTPEAD